VQYKVIRNNATTKDAKSVIALSEVKWERGGGGGGGKGEGEGR
jgi:hypothetical protein